jgi:hypothetical protein
MSKGFVLIGNFTQILGYFIALQVNASSGSITTIDNIMYPIGCSFVLVINDIVYCIIFEMQNYIASFTIDKSSSTTYSSSFRCIAT